MRTISDGRVLMAAAVLPLLLAAAPSVAVDAAPAAHATRVAAADRVADTVLRGQRYDYRRENWRVADADGLPSWLHLRNGRLGGTSPRLGRWRIELEERGVGKQRGERRRTVLVLRSVTERAASGTVLLSRGMGGRPANADSTNVTLSGDGTTAVFASRATNLVPGTEESFGRLYVWDSETQHVSLLHPEAWAVLKGLSDDGRRALVQLTAGLFLLDRDLGTATQVAPRAIGAALTADGERVLFQDRGLELDSPAPRLLEWSRATGVTRTVVPDVGTRVLAGVSGNGRYAVLVDSASSELLDTTAGTFRDIGRLGIEGGGTTQLEVSDDGVLVSVRGVGIAAGHGHGGDAVAAVRETLLGTGVGPARNFGAAITASGSHYAVATPTRHLRVVDVATGVRTSPFRALPSGEETWASLSDDGGTVAYVSDGHDLLRGTRRGVADVYLWVRPR